MFPIRDHNPSKRTPFVTYTLIALNLIMFVLTMPWGGNMGGLWQNFALYAAAITQGEWLWGLVTHMFLHAGLLHLGGNMLFLWIFGDNLEDQMGHLGFLGFYLASGLVAAAAQILAAPYSVVPMVGASGAIAGVMGGYLLLFPRAKVDVVVIIVIIFKVFTLPAWVMLGLWFGFQLFGGFTVAGDGGGVAYWAHAGGFVAGVVLALPLFLRRGGAGFWQATQGHPPHPAATYQRTRIPQVRR
ncbi:rhomboid family intramembrane serine protease (plasmid) [Paracoccus sp. TK19116]|uniref:Rhomboid family intramembrane serine protease n=1 Tax=Paracoccus albicereus TaxID=2922394 RepID=A0ABT1ML91_9RHOB|nr:rhomboid family intramembrane serine protease [Paracoccus albicereus]MCQ0968859.1 rhomboid family intramembrane serine protease [Paracoccus albicereus]